MRTECINKTNFQGKLVIVNKFSDKPKRCVQKVKDDLQKLVKTKDYNLFIQQDYSKNEMRIIADYPFPLKPEQRTPLFTRTQINIPITSKASKYVDAATNVISNFEKNIREKEQLTWEQKQQKQKIEDITDIVESILFFPLFLANNVLHSINPKWSNKFEKLIIDRLL